MAVKSLDEICELMSRADARQFIYATKEAVEAVVKIMQYCDEKTVGIGRINEVNLRFELYSQEYYFLYMTCDLRLSRF